MEEIELKLLTKQDIERYEDDLIYIMEFILKDNIAQAYPYDLARRYVEKMPGYIEDGSATIVGAINTSDKLIGFLWAYELSIFEEKRMHIDMIGVDKEYRAQSIAKKMLDVQIKIARERGIKIFEAMITWNNENSCKWFHSQGFTDERVKVKRVIDDEN